MILQLCALQIVPVDDYINEIFHFPNETPAFQTTVYKDHEKSKFADAGYDSSTFILLIGPIFFLILFYVIFVVLKKLLQLLTCKCGENCATRVLRKQSLQMVIIMRFLLESCLEIGLSAMITVLMMSKETFKSFSEAFSTACAFLSLLALLLAPLYFLRVTR